MTSVANTTSPTQSIVCEDSTPHSKHSFLCLGQHGIVAILFVKDKRNAEALDSEAGVADLFQLSPQLRDVRSHSSSVPWEQQSKPESLSYGGAPHLHPSQRKVKVIRIIYHLWPST